MKKVDNLGLQMQKFGANLKLIANGFERIAHHTAYLQAAVALLVRKNIITRAEIEREIQLQKDAQRVSSNEQPVRSDA